MAKVSERATVSKSGYEERARAAARKVFVNIEVPRPFPRSATSWQAKAYWAAYDIELEKLNKVEAAHEGEGVEAEITRTTQAIAGAAQLPAHMLREPVSAFVKASSVVNVSVNLQPVPKAKMPDSVAAALKISREAFGSLPFDVADQVFVQPATLGWPAGARAHLESLVGDLMQEPSRHRRARLIRKVGALEKRHGPKAAKLLATPMTATGLPEGEVTFGDLLQGR